MMNNDDNVAPAIAGSSSPQQQQQQQQQQRMSQGLQRRRYEARGQASIDGRPRHHDACPFRVVGIALVVDMKGSPARTVLRYPVAPPPPPPQPPQAGTGGTAGLAGGDGEAASVFFRLSPRQMAKLFRPKPALCYQPMTLSVGGTVFCCRAVLMGGDEQQQQQQGGGASGGGGGGDPHDEQQQQQQQQSTESSPKSSSAVAPTNSADNSGSNTINNNNNREHLVLFSVIVALVPHVRVSPIPISGWFEQTCEHHHSHQYGQRSRESFTGHDTDAVGANHATHHEDGFVEETPGSSYDGQTSTAPSSRSTQVAGSSGTHRKSAGAIRTVGDNTTLTTNHEDEVIRASASFLSIRRVHVSLARLCRVLEREERRCSYVSVQASFFDRIRKTLEKQYQDDERNKAMMMSQSSSGASKMGGGQTSNTTVGDRSPVSMNSSKVQAGAVNTAPSTGSDRGGSVVGGSRAGGRSHHHRRAMSFDRNEMGATSGGGSSNEQHRAPGGGGGGGNSTMKNKSLPDDRDLSFERDCAQEVLEIIMAASPSEKLPDSGRDTPHGDQILHQGNLARELVSVYNALARNDHDFPRTSVVLLTGRDGVVYLNRHIAVTVEALSPSRSLSLEGKPDILPYQTLLFPHSSPTQLLESLSVLMPASSSAVAPLRQLLLVANPRKSLYEVAMDASLPLRAVLEIAAYLVGQGICMVSSVISRNSRLACQQIDKIPEVSLAFSQSFGVRINLFLLISLLTDSGGTIGQAMAALCSSDDRNIVWLRQHMESSLPRQHALAVIPPRVGRPTFPIDASEADTKEESHDQRSDELEELLYQMVVWLCSQRVLGHLQEYLVVGNTTSRGSISERYAQSEENTEKKVDDVLLDDATDENLFKELLRCDCLDGRSSLPVCAWKLNVEVGRLRRFALRHHQVRIITRMQASGDDWVS